MKIAVACDEQGGMSQHFGRSAAFRIFSIEEGKVVAVEDRPNDFTAHARGECEGEHHHDQPHSHASIVGALSGCDRVLCRGMGWRAANDLAAGGITPVVVRDDVTPERAVELYLAGALPEGTEFCACH